MWHIGGAQLRAWHADKQSSNCAALPRGAKGVEYPTNLHSVGLACSTQPTEGVPVHSRQTSLAFLFLSLSYHPGFHNASSASRFANWQFICVLFHFKPPIRQQMVTAFTHCWPDLDSNWWPRSEKCSIVSYITIPWALLSSPLLAVTVTNTEEYFEVEKSRKQTSNEKELVFRITNRDDFVKEKFGTSPFPCFWIFSL